MASEQKPTRRRFVLKIALLIFVVVVGICSAEFAFFRYVGNNGWNAAGPDGYFDAQLWFIQFGGVPSDTESLVLAPIVGRGAEHPLEVAPVLTANGLVSYFLGGGVLVPWLPPVQHFRQFFLADEIIYRPNVRGFAGLSSDEVLWCRVLVALPYEFRTREFIGTVDDFLPEPSDSRWHTSHIDLVGFAHNVVIWIVLFGWLFFLRELRDGFRFLFRRRHARIRHGLCGACGYDLRQLETPRCPECGALRDGTAGMWNRQRINRAIVIAGLALTLVAPAYLSLANAPSLLSPGSIWVIAPLLMMESRVLALLSPVVLFGLCAIPVWLRPSLGSKLATALLAMLLALTAVFFAVVWKDAAQWWGTGQFYAMLAVNALCASGCIVLWIRQGRRGTYAAAIAVIYCIWLWMTWAGFPLLYELA